MSYREFYRRRLPHYQPRCVTLFVTFRLAGSLPQAVIDALNDQREAELRKAARMTDSAQRQRQDYANERRAFARWDSALDRCAGGPLWLRRPEIAAVVAEAMHYRDGRVYDLLAFCIMPNHVHLVCTPLPVARANSPRNGVSVVRAVSPHGDTDVVRAVSPHSDVYSLQDILQSLKGNTARRANAILGRKGAFWQAESYDHAVRDEEVLERVVRYVINNPVKAGLVASWRDWPWTYSQM